MIYHNLKVALRNLFKYKLQTVISVLSIAIGIVTLAFTHAALSRVKFPLIYSQPYYDRTYEVSFSKLDAAQWDDIRRYDGVASVRLHHAQVSVILHAHGP